MTKSPTRILRALALLAVLALGSSARAGFQVKIRVDNGAFVPVPMSPVSGGTINISGTYGGVFDITGSADSNSQAMPTPDDGQVNFTFTAVLNSASAHTLEIFASDDGFDFPGGPNYRLTSSASGDWAFGGPEDTLDFTASESHGPASLYGITSSNLTIHLVNDPILFDEFPYVFPGADSGDSGPTDFTSATGYGITAYAKIVLGGQVTDPRSILVTASAIVSAQAVPEPSSLALMALGGLGLVGVIRRRKLATA